MSNLSSFPRFPLAMLPTPLEPMDLLRRHLVTSGLDAPRLWIKRDDATGLAMGGNKTRKLEFLVGKADADGVDTLVTFGATQSNHVRQTAAAAARAGMDCHVILEERTVRDDEYAGSGNVLLNEILGATVARKVPGGADVLSVAHEVASELSARGRRPMVIVGGGSTPLGALGYAVAAEEICACLAATAVVHASGSMGTQAGLMAGLATVGATTRVIGVSVRQPAEAMVPGVTRLARDTCALLNVPVNRLPRTEIDDRWIGPGYAIPTEPMFDALRLLARTEGILLDPVYTGKAFAGLLGMVREGVFTREDDVVFLHTGGTPALFAYRSAIAETSSQSR